MTVNMQDPSKIRSILLIPVMIPIFIIFREKGTHSTSVLIPTLILRIVISMWENPDKGTEWKENFFWMI